MRYDVQRLFKMSQRELDALFSASEAGPVPKGQAEGTAIIAPGTVFSREIASFIKTFAWKGKIFDPNAGRLTNRVGPLGFNTVSAKVYKGPSWVDGRECIVLDYSRTSIIAHAIRDEIRLIEPPGLYLGKSFWNKARLMDFALQF
ncbi:MAG: hypothetical protein JOY71_27820 [Acetobacteraceae bacterium]|nr:hypothetical protein [Acetobacteraceae bacterium]MBV8525876.1 hypothetical protein [Acetobacteraceae bacterium]MBV8592309.1 hypothetical protein [Acetobacteraceae bacterium]